jgi:hypothetical protein
MTPLPGHRWYPSSDTVHSRTWWYDVVGGAEGAAGQRGRGAEGQRGRGARKETTKLQRTREGQPAFVVALGVTSLGPDRMTSCLGGHPSLTASQPPNLGPCMLSAAILRQNLPQLACVLAGAWRVGWMGQCEGEGLDPLRLNGHRLRWCNISSERRNDTKDGYGQCGAAALPSTNMFLCPAILLLLLFINLIQYSTFVNPLLLQTPYQST